MPAAMTPRSILWLLLFVCVAATSLALAQAAQARIFDAPLREVGVDEFIISASAGSGGSIDPSGDVTVPLNGNQSFTITPDDGYRVVDVVVDGVSQGAMTSYGFEGVTAAHTIAATFALKTYAITVSAGAGGEITPGTGPVDHGSSPTYTITPDPGYSIATLTVDGEPQTPQGTWTFTNVTAAHTIAATFALKTYAITASAGPHGSVSPSGQSVVEHGGSLTVSFLPDVSYRVADVKIDDVSLGPLASYTFSDVSADHTVSVTFAWGLETTLDIDVGSPIVSYGRSTTVTGALVRHADGTPIVGGSVALWAADGALGPWSIVETLTTSGDPGAEGTISVRVKPEASSFYSLRYTPAQGTDLAAAISPTVRVKLRPAVGKPGRPSAVRSGKRFTVSGTLAPRFEKGSASLKVRVYRLKGGKWRPVKRVAATLADSGDMSRYSVRLKLKTRGTYRFRAEFGASGGWASAVSQYSGKLRVR